MVVIEAWKSSPIVRAATLTIVASRIDMIGRARTHAARPRPDHRGLARLPPAAVRYLAGPHSVAGQALLELVQCLPAPGADLRGAPALVHRAVDQAPADGLDQALGGADQRG